MIRLYSAKYLLPDSSGALASTALVEEGGRIQAVGPLAQLQQQYPAAQQVDYGEAVILPAFINAHTHLELSLYPQWAADAGVKSDACSFVDWILRLIQVKRGIKPAALTEAVTEGLALSLQAGTAAVGDVLSRYEAREAYSGSPLRGRVFLESLGQDPGVTRSAYKKLKTALAEPHDALLGLGVSPHSPYTIRPQYMEQLFALCRNSHLPCTTHIAESAAECDFLNMGNGELVERLYTEVNWHQFAPPARRLRPLEYLDRQGGLFADQLLVHGVQFDDDEIALLAKSAATLVLCPRSNAQLQVGTAPVAALKQAGVRLALGTDSLASNASLSIWDELAFASEAYAGALSPAELFDIATRGGAEALGLTGQLGSLAPGLRCSFQVVAAPQVARDQLLETLVRSGRSEPVDTLVLDGVDVL